MDLNFNEMNSNRLRELLFDDNYREYRDQILEALLEISYNEGWDDGYSH